MLTAKSGAGRPEMSAEGIFEWQISAQRDETRSRDYTYDRDKYWGDFPPDLELNHMNLILPAWAIGPFSKHPDNPVLAPTPGAWDEGRYDGGVHNGSIVRLDNVFHYVYRGERPIDIPTRQTEVNYICDIGLARSDDGVHFTKDQEYSPFFRRGNNRRYSYEDVSLVHWKNTFYLFCNQWDWERPLDCRVSGVFLATSPDLQHWERHGIVFPQATRIHRNGVVLQNPQNEAVQVNGRFVMYINDGLIAHSEDLLHWESQEVVQRWPGGEGCFALTDHAPERPNDIVLFTGGHHTGHFYGIGEVLLNKADPGHPIAWLPRPVLHADPRFPWEDGLSADPPHEPISGLFRDCIFFNGLTRYDGRWWLYYGGSEYYTCLATAPAK